MSPRSLALSTWALTVLALSCATSVPARFPRGSAAAEDTPPAPLPSAATALRADPPLPGQGSAGWPGLEDGDAGGVEGMAMSGMGHHHHGGMDSGKP